MSVQTQIKTDIHKRLNAMHTARVTWEEGTLRASNDELYAILESVYALYAELKTEVGKRRAFAALLTDLGSQNSGKYQSCPKSDPLCFWNARSS